MSGDKSSGIEDREKKEVELENRKQRIEELKSIYKKRRYLVEPVF